MGGKKQDGMSALTYSSSEIQVNLFCSPSSSSLALTRRRLGATVDAESERKMGNFGKKWVGERERENGMGPSEGKR